MTCEQSNYIQKFNDTSLSVEDALERLKVPLRRLHHDGTGNVAVGPERSGKGTWRNFLILQKISVGDQSMCWPWVGSKCSGGYGFIGMSNRGSTFHMAAHRLVVTLVFGSIPNGLIIRHKCDNPICCNPFHLEPGTMSDNARDMISRGRSNRAGDCNGRSRLSSHQIPEIRMLLNNGERKASIARRFNVSWSTIDWIARGKNWSKV